MDHLTDDELDALLIGAPPSDPAGVRRHLSGCDACARRLATRARLEEDLEQAARRAATRSATRARIALAAAAALVLLMAGAFAIQRASRPGAAASMPPAARSAAPTALAEAPGVPGWRTRIPSLCDDVVSPAEVCLRRGDTDAGWPGGAALFPGE